MGLLSTIKSFFTQSFFILSDQQKLLNHIQSTHGFTLGNQIENYQKSLSNLLLQEGEKHIFVGHDGSGIVLQKSDPDNPGRLRTMNRSGIKTSYLHLSKKELFALLVYNDRELYKKHHVSFKAGFVIDEEEKQFVDIYVPQLNNIIQGDFSSLVPQSFGYNYQIPSYYPTDIKKTIEQAFAAYKKDKKEKGREK